MKITDLYHNKIHDLESQVFERGQIIGKLHDEVAKLKEELEWAKNKWYMRDIEILNLKSTLDEIKSLAEGKHELANWQVSLRHLMSILAKHEGKK